MPHSSAHIENEPNLGCPWKNGLVFQDSEGNFFEITKATGIAKTRLHHLHFDTTDLDASVDFYKKFLNCTARREAERIHHCDRAVGAMRGAEPA